MKAVLIEAFSTRAGAGNGAAVVLLDKAVSATWMQAVATSLRQSETAFLLRRSQDWALRWFTPCCEVPLCGHATLAATIALGHWQVLSPGRTLRFQTRSGPLEAVLRQQPGPGSCGAASIQLPAGALRQEPPPADLSCLLTAELNCAMEGFWRSDLGYAVALLPPDAPLARLRPIAADLHPPWRSGLILMQAITGLTPDAGGEGPRGADYQLRFFAPALGIDEDPVTGSAHALVAPLWMAWLGTSRLTGWQCSDRPGGMVCEASGSGMIRLIGSGHLLWDGNLLAPDWQSSSASQRDDLLW